MPTKINLEINENEWLIKFSKLVRELHNHVFSDTNEYICLKMRDGMVYGYNGVYALTNVANKTYQIIIVTPEHLGITLIDTREVSKTKKRLITQIEIFVTALHKVIVTVSGNGLSPVREFPEHSLDDIREQILKDNSL